MRRLDLRAHRHGASPNAGRRHGRHLCDRCGGRADDIARWSGALGANRFVTARVQRFYSSTARRALAVSGGARHHALRLRGGCPADGRLYQPLIDIAVRLTPCPPCTKIFAGLAVS